ncbi:hypothetical protein H6G00_13360 [Leptolyngbya sp. FACHB-541]|uniref:hypothetical protein n=1 Tax=Leptolyngbya sp. FACHB-541 TaxID=2692810 RepID=UPI001683C16F|nr:hypothetical protein [Leptolyngbya sp. FACHB-541]MBD1997602.1 hypothetical protein [Leptolyngbya sp. FACHB-541]
MKQQSVNYQTLEAVIHSASDKHRKLSLTSNIARLWNRIVESIIAINELKIYPLTSRSGIGYWVIYDPLLARRVFFNSEAEVREWLDRRYYE